MIAANTIIVNESLKKKGVVVLPLRAYEKMKERLDQLKKENKVIYFDIGTHEIYR